MGWIPNKARMANIVFESNDRASKNFDIVLLIVILLSVAVVILDSVEQINEQYGTLLYVLEWLFTLLFTLEYFFRIWLSNDKKGYIFGFYGIVDLLAIVPTYMSLALIEAHYLTVIRALRFLRILRVLKLVEYLQEASILKVALNESKLKIQIFLGTVLTIVLVMGSLMYIIEGPESGFTSIPKSMYWAIVTLTTVGYGDIVPITNLGQFMASIIMLMGYAIIAVPTGIVTSELTAAKYQNIMKTRKVCHECGYQSNDSDAIYCKLCGSEMDKLN
ncbi:ion transporter [Pleomorphovibrio marinus]|uniref:ion transporter n=1 Tax=Pleomorphovibrio marinus TaxID=2164132 RepID=UPI000E0CAAD4|nr:ion transporter [Pleomorphovibrio marinus]